MQPAFPVLQVEPTDHCNLACRMCAPHHEGWETVHGVPKGYLDPALWERVLAGLVADDLRFDHLIFQWLGDPSLHPELDRLVGAAARLLAGRVGYLRVDTNGLLLAGERMDRLVDAVAGADLPLLVVFTIDAHSPEVYADVKGRDALPRVRRNLRRLLLRRRQRGAPVNLQLQFVVQPGNAHEVGPFLRYWQDLLACQGGRAEGGAGGAGGWHDEVLFKRLSVGGGGAGQAEADALYERALAEAGVRPGRQGPVTVHTWERRPWQADDGHRDQPRTACPGLWLTPVIRQDGHLLMCCADLHSELDLGSLAGAGFRELWEGSLATSKRLQHLGGRFEGVCATCGGINWYDLPEALAGQARARGQALGLSG